MPHSRESRIGERVFARTLFVDLETFSATKLRKAGVYRYVEDPLFEVLMAGYALDDEPVRIAIGEDEIVQDVLPLILDPNILKVAHNAGFERVCFSVLNGHPVGEYLPPDEWDDTMALAAEYGLPQSLDALARMLNSPESLKETAGKRLVKLFTEPKRGGGRNDELSHPEDWDKFCEYCRQDVVAHRDAYRKLVRRRGWPSEEERQLWIADQRVNDRGVTLDIAMARKAVQATERNLVENQKRIRELTGVANPRSVPQFMAWVKQAGLPLPNLQADTVEQVVESLPEADPRREALELRLDIALSASSKYVAALEGVNSDRRIRGGFRFYGAHTGRWAGRGLQLHNLPRASFDNVADQEFAIEDLMETGALAPYELKKLVRALLLGPFVVVDYNAIEARVIAWLAGEEWALEAFSRGRDIYVETAERMSSETTRFDRRQGKIAVLALGFGGGSNSLLAMGYQPELPELPPEAEADRERLMKVATRPLVEQWRAANPAIKQFWSDLHNAFRFGGTAGRITVEADGDRRRMVLPSGRSLVYRNYKYAMVRKTFEDENGVPYTKVVGRMSYQGWKGPMPVRIDTYGGRLAENATQAVARDILGAALVRLDKAGYRPVAHVHDEIVVEGTDQLGVLQEMVVPPKWAEDLPIGAEGFVCDRYRKG